MKFNLEIEMGNDAMLTRQDVAQALVALSKRLVDERFTPQDEDLTDEGSVLDTNGNSVGTWEFKEE